jgi:hypothetical protein
MKFDFTGFFSPNSDVKPVPPILLSFQQMILDRPGIMKENTPAPAADTIPAAALSISISQIITYNTMKHRSTNPGGIPQHIRERENPLTSVIYVAIKIHTNTRMGSLVECVH